MRTTVPVQKASNLMEAFELDLLQPEVTCRGDYYHVDFSETIFPRRHQVFHLNPGGLVCLCELGSNCPSIVYVQQYMISLQFDPANPASAEPTNSLAIPKLATVHPDDYMLRFIPRICPECGGQVRADIRLNTRTPEGLPVSGWACLTGGARCFLRKKMRQSAPDILARRQANPDPWLIPPHEATGYPGVRLSEFGQPRAPILTETTLWFANLQPIPVMIQTEDARV